LIKFVVPPYKSYDTRIWELGSNIVNTVFTAANPLANHIQYFPFYI